MIIQQKLCNWTYLIILTIVAWNIFFKFGRIYVSSSALNRVKILVIWLWFSRLQNQKTSLSLDSSMAELLLFTQISRVQFPAPANFWAQPRGLVDKAFALKSIFKTFLYKFLILMKRYSQIHFCVLTPCIAVSSQKLISCHPATWRDLLKCSVYKSST